MQDKLSFNDLKTLLRTTDGNLSVHARKLEDAGYISCTKTFEGRLPRSEYSLTRAGRVALDRYLGHMEALITVTRAGSAKQQAGEEIPRRRQAPAEAGCAAGGCVAAGLCPAVSSSVAAPCRPPDKSGGYVRRHYVCDHATVLVSVPMPSMVIATSSPLASVNASGGTMPVPVKR